jgi:hypothetical protein
MTQPAFRNTGSRRPACLSAQQGGDPRQPPTDASAAPLYNLFGYLHALTLKPFLSLNRASICPSIVMLLMIRLFGQPLRPPQVSSSLPLILQYIHPTVLQNYEWQYRLAFRSRTLQCMERKTNEQPINHWIWVKVNFKDGFI